jgi:hypothetical protein
MKKNTCVLLFCLSLSLVHSNKSITFFDNFTWWWDNTKEEIVTHDQPLAPHSHISVSNKKGNITISTWNKNKIVIEATKKGTDEELKLTKVETLYTKNGASIKTIPLKVDRQCSVDYTLIIPSTATLTMVETEKGSISIKNVSTATRAHAEYGSVNLDAVTNSVQVSTKHGGITIQSKNLKATDKIIALAEHGSIKLELPAETNATLYAKTNKGTVTSEQPITLEPRTLKICQASLAELKRDVRGALGHGGGATIKLQTSRGNVRVVEAA